MKPIKDCSYTVSIVKPFLSEQHFWLATSREDGCDPLYSSIIFNTNEKAREHWEKFAKLNKITRWGYKK